MKDIELLYDNMVYAIPNRWEGMASDHYLHLVADLLRMADGKLSAGEVRINHLLRLMSWNRSKFRSEEQIANLVAISEQLTFLFQINYPDDNDVLASLDEPTYRLCRRVDPFRLHHPLARVLRRLDYHYVVDLCFCAQLLPSVTVGQQVYKGYTVSTDFGMLTCSLTVLQYIEARELIGQGTDSLPLLAAILYYPEAVYDSGQAHALSKRFATLPLHVLTAISFNFQAFNNYLFSRTSFSLLSKFLPGKPTVITTDAMDALYDLSKDGLGDAGQIEQMNMLTYLKVLRKKTIDVVRSLHAMEWDKLKISNEVGLPINIIDKIL